MTVHDRLVPYLARLYKFAYGLTRDDQDAQDLVQTCALKALSAKSIPSEDAAFRTWLFRILRNEFIDRLRRERRAEELLGEGGPFEPQVEYSGTDDRLIDVLSARIAFGRLSLPDREILALIDLAGFSYEESARTLDCPVGTVMSRVSRARKRLLADIDGSNVRAFPARNRRGAS